MTADIDMILERWRGRRSARLLVIGGTAAITGAVLLVGGPPTPWTHLYYLSVLATGFLWGPRWGVAVGAVCGVLAEPGARAAVNELDDVDPGWVIRAGAMMLVGWACGSLTRSLMRRVRELERLNEETIFAFVRAIDARDPHTARHSEKVAAHAVRLARQLGLGPADCERIRLSGLLHDVGKLALERSVLHKPGGLDDDEWAQVREHPVFSARIIEGVTRFAPFLPGARHHHERFDGRGYPDGLAGEDIPLDARILAVADAYDAMTSDRSYRPALPHAEAVRRLREGAGTQFDPRCVAAFEALDHGRAAARDAATALAELTGAAVNGIRPL